MVTKIAALAKRVAKEPTVVSRAPGPASQEPSGTQCPADIGRSLGGRSPLHILLDWMLRLIPLMIVLLDQAVKALVLWRMSPGVPIDVIGGLVALRLGLNPGLDLALLAGLGSRWRSVIALLSIAAVTVLARVAYRAVSGRLARLGIGLVFGGVVGNLIDRARLGAVVDFIDIYWRGYHWPPFNTADVAITAGLFLVALTVLRPGIVLGPSR